MHTKLDLLGANPLETEVMTNIVEMTFNIQACKVKFNCDGLKLTSGP